jgi:hypothetical protein
MATKKSNKLVNVNTPTNTNTGSIAEGVPAVQVQPVAETPNTPEVQPEVQPVAETLNTPEVQPEEVDGAVEIQPEEVEDLGDESTEDGHDLPAESQTGVSSNISADADAFLQTLVGFKSQGLVKISQRGKHGQGCYPAPRVLELFQSQGLTLPTLAVLKEAAPLIPNVRNVDAWAEAIDKGRNKASKGLKETLRSRYAL